MTNLDDYVKKIKDKQAKSLEYVRKIDRRAREKAKKKHVTVRLRFGNNTLKWPNNIKWREEPAW